MAMDRLFFVLFRLLLEKNSIGCRFNCMYTDKDKKKAVKALVADDGLSHVDMIHVLEHEDCALLHLSEAGVVLRHCSGTVFAASFSPDTDPLVDAVPLDSRLLDVHDERLFRIFSSRGYSFEEPCYLFSYHGTRKDEGRYAFREFSQKDFPIYAEYYKSGDDEELMKDVLDKRVVGIYDDEILMGFAGFHKEGSMGMLEVFPPFRRKGVGTCLLSHLINLRLDSGRVPFCNVYVSNVPSIRLQTMLKMSKAKGLSYWLWR